MEYVLRSGDLKTETTFRLHRAVEGIQAHQKIQEARPEEYVPEVPIVHQIECEHFVLEIGGRIDGVYQYPDRVIIEEIKTTLDNPDTLENKENHCHWGQVKTYAYLYVIQHDLETIETRLLYYQIDTGEIKEFQRDFHKDELENFFQDLLARYLEWANTVEDWYHTRDNSIRELEFPFSPYRAGQRRMAVEVYVAIRDKSQVLAQAPTGIGKTIAALFPAIKAIAEGHTSKIFYLTARTTGRTAAEQAIDLFLRLKSLTLTAKEKICFCPEKNCNSDECEFSRGYFDRISQAVKEAFQQDTLYRETIETIARQYTVCPFEFSLDLSLWTDCIICDYNYAFDPRVYLRRFFLEARGEYTFLVDEAHNLVDRAREMFSAELCKQAFLEVRRSLKKPLPGIYKTMGKINSWFLKARKRCNDEGDVYVENMPPETLLPLLKKFIEQAETWLSRNIRTFFYEPLLDLYFEVNRFIKVAEEYDERYATCFERKDKGLRIKLFCLDPSARLADALTRCQSVIFFSATMTPIAYFQKIFGCHDSARQLLLPSPFPQEHLCLLIANRISTLYRQRDRTISEVTQAIVTMVTQKQGNYLLFSPSYQYMQKIYHSFTETSPDIETILQTPGMSEDEREEFIQRFAHDNPETFVGFAVMGGIFGEGIDLMGDRLTGAAIVGVGLPGISPERNLIRDYFTNLNGSGFEYAYLYPGINRVLQAVGRVIRSETDRGVVLLIDQRFSTRRYRTLFPQEWRPLKIQDPQQIRQCVRNFWNVTS